MNDSVNFVDPMGLYVTDGGNENVNNVVEDLYNRSETFKDIYDGFARDENMVFQFSHKTLNEENKLGETDSYREVSIPSKGIPAITVDENGDKKEVIVMSPEVDVVFMNIDVNKSIERANDKDLHPATQIAKVISHEAPHGEQAQKVGIQGFWDQVDNEANTNYSERPMEVEAEKISEKIMNEYLRSYEAETAFHKSANIRTDCAE